jgi:hypothetical protein
VGRLNLDLKPVNDIATRRVLQNSCRYIGVNSHIQLSRASL